MVKVALFFLIAASSLSLFATTFEEPQRYELSETTAAFQPLGKVSGAKGFCSGVLIEESIVATAAHCILVEDKNSPDGYVVAPGKFQFQTWRTKVKANVVKKASRIGTMNPQLNRSQDWALLVLDAPIGRKAGFWRLKNLADVDPVAFLKDLRLHVFAYSSDAEDGNKVYGEYSQPVIASIGNLFLHYFSITTGSSGSPILYFEDDLLDLESTRLIAIHVAEPLINGKAARMAPYEPKYANRAVPVQNFWNDFVELKASLGR